MRTKSTIILRQTTHVKEKGCGPEQEHLHDNTKTNAPTLSTRPLAHHLTVQFLHVVLLQLETCVKLRSQIVIASQV